MQIDPLMRLNIETEARERAVEAYVKARKNRTPVTDLSKTAYGHSSHIEVAGMVRMLSRDDLAHEAIICAARDRIEWLAYELEATQNMLAAYGHITESMAVDTDVMQIAKDMFAMSDTKIKQHSDKKWDNTYIDGTVNNKKCQIVFRKRKDE